MPSLDQVVNISIVTAAAQISRAGYGTALIVGGAAAAAVESNLTTTYVSSDYMLTAGYLETDPEYLAAVALMAQMPCPVSFKVGKRSNLPTQSILVTPTAATLTPYTVVLNGVTTAVFTSAGTNVTPAQITAALKTNIDLLAPTLSWVKNTAKVVGNKVKHNSRIYECITAGTTQDADSVGPAVSATPRSQNITDGTAHWKFLGVVPTVTDNTGTLTIASPIAGEYIRVKPTSFNLLRCMQNHVNNAIATDMAAISLFDDQWYAVVDCFPSTLATVAMAGWVESAKKLHVVGVTDIGTCMSSATTDDVATALAALAYARTSWIFNSDPGEFIDAAWFGSRLPLDPGSETWAYCTLAGITAAQLTPAQQGYATGTAALAYADGKKGNIYIAIGGLAATWPGIVVAREFIDKVRGCDALRTDMQADVYERIVAASTAGKKIPYTDAGISVLKTAMTKTLGKYVGIGFLTEGTTYVNAPKAVDCSTADKQARTLADVTAGGVIAGAIHQLEALITLTYS